MFSTTQTPPPTGRQTGSINNVLSTISDTEFSVIEVKVLRNLQHQTLGLWLVATPDNPKQMSGGANAIFRGQTLRKIQHYNNANKYDEGETVSSDILANIPLSPIYKIKYEIETTDMAGMEDATVAQWTSYIANGISLSLSAYMDCIWIDTAYGGAIQSYQDGEDIALVIDADWLNLDDDTKARKAYRAMSRAKIALSRQLTKYDIGANFGEFGSFVHDFITNDALLVISKQGGGNTATTMSQKLLSYTRDIAGLGIVKDHVFFGQKVAKGFFTEDDEFDFTKLVGIIAHNEAIFVALGAMNIVSRINAAGNPEYITKFNYFQGVVRPNLISALVTEAPGPQQDINDINDADIKKELIANHLLDFTKIASANTKPPDATMTLNRVKLVNVVFNTWTPLDSKGEIAYKVTLSLATYTDHIVYGTIKGFIPS